MGLLGTIATFGLGYAAGTATGRRAMERMPARVREAMPERISGGAPPPPSAAGVSEPLDVRQVRQVMTAAPDVIRTTDTVQAAAQLMRSSDIGDVLVVDDREMLAGILTDRDLAIRAVADGIDPGSTTVFGLFSTDIATVAPTDSVHDAVQLMRARDVRRLPVVEAGRAIGVITLGDIAVDAAPTSILADISSASPDR